MKLEISEEPPFPVPDLSMAGKPLSAIQQAAADEMCASVREHKFHVALLDGVTGSGKTEIYLEAAAEALNRTRATPFHRRQLVKLADKICDVRDMLASPPADRR